MNRLLYHCKFKNKILSRTTAGQAVCISVVTRTVFPVMMVHLALHQQEVAEACNQIFWSAHHGQHITFGSKILYGVYHLIIATRAAIPAVWKDGGSQIQDQTWLQSERQANQDNWAKLCLNNYTEDWAWEGMGAIPILGPGGMHSQDPVAPSRPGSSPNKTSWFSLS